MLDYVTELVNKRVELSETQNSISARAAAEERMLTDVEEATIADIQTQCGPLDAKIRTANEQLESQRAFAELQSRMEARRDEKLAEKTNGHRAPAVEQRSFGQQFVESNEFRSYTGRGSSGRVPLEGFLETRAVIATTNLAIPHVVVPPIESVFRSVLLEVCNRITVSSGVVDWVEIGPDPVAAVVAEGAAKPEAAVTFTPKSASLDTLAHWVQITRQALDDATYVRSLLETKLRRGLLAKAEADMATAIDTATTLTASTSTAAGGNMLKSIRQGIGKVEAAGYNPNAVLLNPTDYASIDIDVMGTTDYGPTRAATFWGLRPVASNSITAGKAYVGDFQAGATLFDRGATNVFLSDSHASLFISNVLVILAEARVKSVVDEPNAICECTVAA